MEEEKVGGLDQERLLRAAGPVPINVQVPLEVLWDFDSLVAIHKEILGRLGCLSCTSGFDIRWRGVRDFVVNPQRQILAVNEVNQWGGST